MTTRKERGASRSDRVREPVQVYLDGPDQTRLERLAERLNSTKSDVLRRGLESLERQLTDPSHHPAMRIVGLLAVVPDLRDLGPDVALEHDRVLADEEERSWRSEPDAGPNG
jgi:Arc/MetJ-type ribon-helix-helix transcriptional regulator